MFGRHIRQFSIQCLFLATGAVGSFVVETHVKEIEKELFREGLSSQIVLGCHDLLHDMKDIETGDRGYLIKGRNHILKPYYYGLNRLDEHSAKLKAKVRDDDIERPLFSEAHKAINLLKSEFARQIKMVEADGLAAAQERFDVVETKPIMDRVRRSIRAIMAEEDRRLETEQRLLRRGIANAMLFTDLFSWTCIVMLVAISMNYRLSTRVVRASDNLAVISRV